nr:zinc finger, CCHC-type [Tanacetum cinerariifolium]
MKKSSGFVKKGKRDQDFDSSNDEGNAYFGEALVVVGNDEMTEGSSKERLSNEEVKWVCQEGKRDQDFDSSNDE